MVNVRTALESIRQRLATWEWIRVQTDLLTGVQPGRRLASSANIIPSEIDRAEFDRDSRQSPHLAARRRQFCRTNPVDTHFQSPDRRAVATAHRRVQEAQIPRSHDSSGVDKQNRSGARRHGNQGGIVYRSPLRHDDERGQGI